MTMSTSSAPASTAARVSATLMSRNVWPDGKPGGDAGDLHGRAPERLLGLGDQRRVDADRGDGRDRRVARLRPHRLDAHRPDLARRVLPLERRQIHHRDREVERPHLRRLLDRAALERIDPLLDADLVDRASPARAGCRAGPGGHPRPDQLVGALAGRAVGASGRRHGTERIHRPRPRTAARRRAYGPVGAPVARGGMTERRVVPCGLRCDGRSGRSRSALGLLVVLGASVVLAADTTIQVADFSFPSTTTIQAGDTVTWTNSSGAGHTATADGGSFDTGTIADGASASVTFDDVGLVPLPLHDPRVDDRHDRRRGGRAAARRSPRHPRTPRPPPRQRAATGRPLVLAVLGVGMLVGHVRREPPVRARPRDAAPPRGRRLAPSGRRGPWGAAAGRACPRRGSGGTSPARPRGSRPAGTACRSGSARGSPRARAAAGPGRCSERRTVNSASAWPIVVRRSRSRVLDEQRRPDRRRRR